MPPWYTGPDPLDLNRDGNTGGTQGNNWFSTETPVVGFPEDELDGDVGITDTPDNGNENANAGDGLGWFPTTGPVIPQGPVLPEDGPWFPGLDNAVGGAADSVTNGGEYIVGGAGDVFHGGVGGVADVIEDSSDWALGGSADAIGNAGDWAGRGIGGSIQGMFETAGASLGGLIGGLGRESGAGDVAGNAFGGMAKMMLIFGVAVVGIVGLVLLL